MQGTAGTTARMRGRLVLNGRSEIRGALGEITATHVTLATAIWLQGSVQHLSHFRSSDDGSVGSCFSRV